MESDVTLISAGTDRKGTPIALLPRTLLGRTQSPGGQMLRPYLPICAGPGRVVAVILLWSAMAHQGMRWNATCFGGWLMTFAHPLRARSVSRCLVNRWTWYAGLLSLLRRRLIWCSCPHPASRELKAPSFFKRKPQTIGTWRGMFEGVEDSVGLNLSRERVALAINPHGSTQPGPAAYPHRVHSARCTDGIARLRK